MPNCTADFNKQKRTDANVSIVEMQKNTNFIMQLKATSHKLNEKHTLEVFVLIKI